MTAQLAIAYLPHRREEYADLTVYSLSRMSPAHKAKVELNILTAKHAEPLSRWDRIVAKCKTAGLPVNVVDTTHEYMRKVNYAISRPIEYSVKLDEDCFMSEHAWEFLIDNLGILDDPKNVILAPSLSNGIPSCEQFLDDFFSDEERGVPYEMFRRTHIPNMWGVDYSSLNGACNAGWDRGAYYEAVSRIQHHYRGIHPIRINEVAQHCVNELVLKHVDQFSQKHAFGIKQLVAPYFCNSFFAIKTALWKRIVEDKSLFRDAFDEVPINIYRQNIDGRFMFITKCFAVHTMYNTLYGGECSADIEGNKKREAEFFKAMKKAIMGE